MSKEKRSVPKLRFPGFTEDWEQRKLSDILVERNEQQIETSEYPLMSFVQGIGVTPKGERYDRSFLVLDQSKKYKRTELGDFIYSSNNLETGSIGINKTGKAVISPVYSIFYGVSIGDSEFIGIMSLLPRFIAKMIRFRQGVVYGQWRIHEKDFLDISVSIPSVNERTKITKLILSIEELITLHQRKLEHLNLKKKALLQKLFPKNGERYPELRFPGFTDAWEQCKLGEIFEYLQNNTLSRDSLNYKNPNIKNIHYGDILVKFDEILDGSNKDIPYINSELDLSKFSKSLLRDGDIIFSDTAEDDTVGKAIELQNVNAPFILGGLHTIPCRPLIPFGKGYLGNFLNSDSYRLQLRSLIQGIKVSSISKSALKDTMIEYPKNLDEQEKIGSLFYYIAKMITLHQRKLEHLQLQKKALLQQMFV